uniref:Acyltransferase n=1 Tax=Attheya septentrionalis TaxID=420275 RepID=A0A7S2XL44_9STRA|mmetsp:Transcript_16043/g.29189  ORF Transcript_16043/g.29189 Transcript_16043/m.29189 type:complete len:372 (+) Transcript_16043:96-1211(+)
MEDKGEGRGRKGEERKKGVDRSKWKVVDTPQDASLWPTLAVTLWLGWMGFLVKGSIWVVFFTSPKTKLVWLGLCTLSLVLPPRFPEPFGRKIVGAWLMTNAERYFGLKTTVEDPDELELCSQTSALIFAKEPHDILPYSVFCFADSINRVLPQKNISALTTGAIFQIPFIKQVYSWVGCSPVDKKTFRRKLERNESFCFVPGGAQEVLMLSDMRGKSSTTKMTTEERRKEEERNNAIPLYLKNRKGFVKMALSTGSPIVPVFAFGLDKSYDYWIPPGLSNVSRKMGFVPVLFTGRFGIPFGIPKPTKIHVVIGRPIMIPKITDDDQPKDDTTSLLSTMIEKYHAIYLEELEALYERHKHDEGYGHRKLIIF